MNDTTDSITDGSPDLMMELHLPHQLDWGGA